MNPPASEASAPPVEWKEIPGFTKYEVSSDGEIRNKRSGIIRTLDTNSRGYYRIRVQIKGAYHRLMVHRCVALAFIPNPENKKCCDHIDNNPKNNKLSNLRWTTHSENMLNQKMRTGKTLTRHKNIVKQGKKFKWRITVNGQIHRSDEAFETEEKAYEHFLTIVKSLSAYASTPVPNAV